MINTIIHLGIAYAFYVAPFSKHDITNLDKILIRLTKVVRNIPNNSSNILTQLPQITSRVWGPNYLTPLMI